MHSYKDRLWQVTEQPFRPHEFPHLETILTIGNGLVGTRGTLEEGHPGDTSTTLAAGIFNQTEGTSVPDLVSMPNWLTLQVSINGELCRLDRGTILGYERVLDMRTAVLRRGVLWLSPKGDILRLAFERFASQSNPHLLALRVEIQVLSEGDHTIEVYSALDGTIRNPGEIDHWERLEGHAEQDTLNIEGLTDQSGYSIAMSGTTQVDGISVDWMGRSAVRCPGHVAVFTLSYNQQVVVTKMVALHTTRDTDNPAAASRSTLTSALNHGYSALKAAHVAAWERIWDTIDIVIEGDEVAQRAVRFCTYHMLIAVPQDDERVSIGAKTLSGFGYKGHVFWDTELFLIPPLSLARPDDARRLLMYRYHNLPGARQKAADNGYEGAMFPWESADTGEETTPQWTDPHPVTGERVRIWTGDNEQHISSDIAYTILQFWRWTGDDDWFTQYGAEIVVDTAKFWGSRVEYNQARDRYELSNQIGPDEYHENVDNSVFTNCLVRWHLEQALEVLAWLRQQRPDDAERLAKLLDLNEERLQHWEIVARKMWIPISDKDGGVFEQFEGFFRQLQPFNLADYTPRTVNMDWILGHEKIQRTRVIKQADVVMLMALLGKELGDAEFLRSNWDIYAPVVDHGSSLSPSIHAWVAARLGLLAAAYDLFIYAATIDLDDNKGNVRDGIHAASCGGVWQAVVFGFCGLELAESGPVVNPALPDHWRRVRFKVVYNGEPITFDLVAERGD